MTRLLSSLAVLLTLAGAAQATARETAARKPVLAATASGLTYRVFRADPISLRPVAGGRSWASAGFMDTLRSPDGTWLAALRNDGSAIRLVRLARMRLEGNVRFGRVQVRPGGWASDQLLVASTALRGTPGAVVGIGATARRVVGRPSRAGPDLRGRAGSADRVFALAGPWRRSGRPSLLLVSAKG